MKWTEEELGTLREIYPTSTAEEVNAVLAHTPKAISKMAHLCGLRKTEDTRHRIMVKRARKYNTKGRAGLGDKIAQARRDIATRERRRLRLGLPQLTRLRICVEPRHIQNRTRRIRHLLRVHGYKVDAGTETAYYTPETSRVDEHHYETKGFTFLPMEGDGESDTIRGREDKPFYEFYT